MAKLQSSLPGEPGGAGVMGPSRQMKTLRLREVISSSGQRTKAVKDSSSTRSLKIGLGMACAGGQEWGLRGLQERNK